MARVEALTKERGLNLVRLYTNKAFTANLDFYRALGYAIEREEPLPAGGFIVHFVKTLSQS